MNNLNFPLITQTQWNEASQSSPRHFTFADICNKAIEIALADQTTQEQYITADEAQELGLGNAEYSDTRDKWHLCDNYWTYQKTSAFDGSDVKYRAIRKEAKMKTIHELLTEAQREMLDGSQQKAHDNIDQALAILEQIGKDLAGAPVVLEKDVA